MATRGEALGELQVREHVAERQPREQHHIQLAGGGCFHFHWHCPDLVTVHQQCLLSECSGGGLDLGEAGVTEDWQDAVEVAGHDQAGNKGKQYRSSGDKLSRIEMDISVLGQSGAGRLESYSNVNNLDQITRGRLIDYRYDRAVWK